MHWNFLILAAVVSLAGLCSSPAWADECPAGYTQVGEQREETATSVITHPVCMPDEDAAQCKVLKSQIDQMVAAGRRANLANDVYSFYEQTGGWQAKWKAPSGFTLLSNDIEEDRKLFPGMSPQEIANLVAPPGSSYRAAIYRDDKTHDIFLVFRGTTEQIEDWTEANIPNEQGVWTAYFAKAQTLAKLLKQSANMSRVKLEIIGHSLGGGMATAAALAATAQATVFNAEAFRSDAYANPVGNEAAVTKALVTNYVTPGEAVTALQGPDAATRGLGDTIGPALARKVTLPEWAAAPVSAFERHKMSSVRLAIQSHLDALKKDYAENACPD